ncbi:MAG: rhodanese-like domain-containing protein [Gammaproteobacteria bacterium]|nr:rhodanese-like domain-containing protein [Gammaproteobacteria bacterium]
MRNLILLIALACLPLKAWTENGAVLEALEDFLEFAEYAEGAITPDQLSSVGLQAFLVVDTRLDSQFDKGHIPGAVNIEWRDVVAKRDQLPLEKPIILYCDTGLLSSKAHFALRLLGRENVKVLFGGFNSWLMQQGLSSVN